MSSTLLWSIVTAVVCGLLFGTAAGNTPIGIGVAIAVGLVVAAIMHYRQRRRRPNV
jgi:membrane protein implicated in regulation of membrane protease activity